MSNEKRRKLASTNSPLPLINYKKSISLVLLLLVTFTSPSTQSPLTQYDCPSGCVCDETQLSAKCDNIDALIESYSIKEHHHVAKKNFMPIKSLDLSNNRLTKISNQLELLVNLTELNLSHNRLTQVHKLNFDHLETLDLSFNKITSGKLSKLPKNVVHLKLSHNQITYLPSDFMKLKKLRSLELTENPLNCSCETLMIRNWITYQHVWSDKIIKCASPQIFKGLPWLQARQNDICIETTSTTTQKSKYNWDEQEYEDNDIMGDQPIYEEDEELHGDGEDGHVTESDGKEDGLDEDKTTKKDDYDDTDGVDVFASDSPSTHEDNVEKHDEIDYDENEEKDEIENDFIPITSTKAPASSSSEVPESKENKVEEDEEGSGSEKPTTVDVKIEDEEDNASGSGGGLPETPNLGIFQEETTSTTTEAEATLASGLQKGAVVDKTPSSGADPDALNKANVTEDNTGTYILLVIIGVLLISLIIFVAMKNRQEKRNSKRRYDVEKNGATELQDMDKSLLGKPIDRNGNGKHEHSPLISDNHQKDDGFLPYTTPAITVDEPIQEVPQKEKEKSQQSLYENGLPNGNGNVFEPIEPVHNTNGSVPKSPDSDEEVFHPATDNLNGPDSLEAPVDTPKRYSPIYTPISPRSARYSPVYSPETGRVKIKLTETPKPKTPVVVTRSRSRAGDYVNTPNN